MITLYMRGGLVYAWRNVTFSGSTHKVRNNLVMNERVESGCIYSRMLQGYMNLIYSMQMQLQWTKSMVSVNTHVPQGALDLKSPNQSRKGAWVEFEPKGVKVKR